jgi:hypothetical protein
MPRKQANYRLDDRVVDAINSLAQDANISANRYVENLLFEYAKNQGKIPSDARPLGETRGGARIKGEPDPSAVEFEE